MLISFYALTKQRQAKPTICPVRATTVAEVELMLLMDPNLVINILLNKSKGASSYPVHSRIHTHTHTYLEGTQYSPFFTGQMLCVGWQRHLIYIPTHFPWQCVFVLLYMSFSDGFAQRSKVRNGNTWNEWLTSRIGVEGQLFFVPPRLSQRHKRCR